MTTTEVFRAISPTRQKILTFLKTSRDATTSEVACRLGITDEGARQHRIYLESEGWIERSVARDGEKRSGRPTSRYAISKAGEDLFPKRYDELALVLLDKIAEKCGGEALVDILSDVVDQQVTAWEEKLRGLSLEEKLEALKCFYLADDPFTTVERDGSAHMLVERNCPFANVAMKRPQLCSTTVSTLSRLLGFRVQRRQRFQNGDGRCTFRVCADEPVDPSFRFEFEPDTVPNE